MPLAPASPNTVQLGSQDCGDGRAGGLGPVAVLGAFDVPLDVFAFDEPWVAAVAAGRVQSLAQQGDRVVQP